MNVLGRQEVVTPLIGSRDELPQERSILGLTHCDVLKCSFWTPKRLYGKGAARHARMALPSSGADDCSDGTLRIVDHASMVVEYHRLHSRRIGRTPSNSRIARCSEICPGGSHRLCERLCLGRIARALLAALCIVETERKLGRVPSPAYAVELGRLPSEPILINRGAPDCGLLPDHSLDTISYGEPAKKTP